MQVQLEVTYNNHLDQMPDSICVVQILLKHWQGLGLAHLFSNHLPVFVHPLSKEMLPNVKFTFAWRAWVGLLQWNSDLYSAQSTFKAIFAGIWKSEHRFYWPAILTCHRLGKPTNTPFSRLLALLLSFRKLIKACQRLLLLLPCRLIHI